MDHFHNPYAVFAICKHRIVRRFAGTRYRLMKERWVQQHICGRKLPVMQDPPTSLKVDFFHIHVFTITYSKVYRMIISNC
jgi:hypothetical protein